VVGVGQDGVAKAVGLRARFIESFDLRNVSSPAEHRDAAPVQKQVGVARGARHSRASGSITERRDSSLERARPRKAIATIPPGCSAAHRSLARTVARPRSASGVTPGQETLDQNRLLPPGVLLRPGGLSGASVISTCIASCADHTSSIQPPAHRRERSASHRQRSCRALIQIRNCAVATAIVAHETSTY